MLPEISILLPFHSSSATLERAVQSIIGQSFQDWELILTDNNADEKSRGIAENFYGEDQRIKLIRESRQGIAFALNTGLRHASAPFIARMDSDDVSHPHRLILQLDYLKSNPGIGLVSCCCAFSSSAGKAEGYHEFVKWQNRILTPEQHFLNRFVESPVAHPSVMFRKELVRRYGNYDTGPVPEDYELWLRWMEKGVKFAKLEQELLEWNDLEHRLSREHPDYSEEAFFEVKSRYLVRWIRSEIGAERKVIVCGTGKKSRRGGKMLENSGIPVYGFTDVKPKVLQGRRFVPLEDLKEEYFYVSFIAKRGVRESIRGFFKSKGLEEEEDFILAG